MCVSVKSLTADCTVNTYTLVVAAHTCYEYMLGYKIKVKKERKKINKTEEKKITIKPKPVHSSCVRCLRMSS